MYNDFNIIGVDNTHPHIQTKNPRYLIQFRTLTKSFSSKAIQMWESIFNLAEACSKLTQVIKLEKFMHNPNLQNGS
jgi:hypothetical protein